MLELDQYNVNARKRFWAKVAKGDPDDCWVWQSTRYLLGYGVFNVCGKQRYAHRIAFEEVHGEITPGLVICHSCDNPGCVNPSHLWQGTPQDNVHDAIKKGRFVATSQVIGRTGSQAIHEWLFGTGRFATIEEIATAFGKPRHWVDKRIGPLMKTGKVARYYSKPFSRYASLTHSQSPAITGKRLAESY